MSIRERARQSVAGAYLSWRYKYKPAAQVKFGKAKVKASEAKAKYAPKIKSATKSAFAAGVAYGKKQAKKRKKGRKKRK